MQYKVFKLDFNSGIHFGNNSLEDSDVSFSADTLFSALCIEAVRMGTEYLDKLLNLTKNNKILFSDAFPYSGDEYYIPKPMLRIEHTDSEGDSSVKKAYKKLKYIPCSELEEYLSGQFDVSKKRGIDHLGEFEMKVSASIRGEDETVPYRLGTYYFYDGNGLYFIVGYEDEVNMRFIEELLEILSFSGIGGKRTAGLGRFELLTGKIPDMFTHRLDEEGIVFATLSISLAKEDELQQALEGASYLLKKRSGFVQSEKYSASQSRKKNLYMFTTGSCFQRKYEGDIFNVTSGGSHPVYRYGKPFFIKLM